MYSFKFIPIILILFAISACTNSQNLDEKLSNKTDSTSIKDSSAQAATCSTKPIKDPNHPKPMALMMRQMAAFADSMRLDLINGKSLDESKYPLLHFHLVEPTDPEVLKPSFYENARQFQMSWKALFKQKHPDKTGYNAVIAKCIQCHQEYCSGPLKRIHKLTIE